MTAQTAIFLLTAIAAKVITTTALRLSEGFSRLAPSHSIFCEHPASVLPLNSGAYLRLEENNEFCRRRNSG